MTSRRILYSSFLPIFCIPNNTLSAVAVADAQAHPIGGDDVKPRREQRGPSGGQAGGRGSHGGAHGEKPFLFSPRRLLHDSGETTSLVLRSNRSPCSQSVGAQAVKDSYSIPIRAET